MLEKYCYLLRFYKESFENTNMSKRLSGGKNTLFNYFSPKSTPSSKENIPEKFNLSTTNGTPKRVQMKQENSDSGRIK